MRISAEQHPEATILRLAGALDIGRSSPLGAEVAKTQKNVVIDLANVTYVDAAGIGELVSAYTQVVYRGDQLVLLNPHQRLREVLEVTQLILVFSVFYDEKEALASFEDSAP